MPAAAAGRRVTDDARLKTQRVILLAGAQVGLAALEEEDAPTLARWHQDPDFAARLGVPGEVPSVEGRRERFARNGRIGPESAAFAVIDLGSGRLVGSGGRFDMSRAQTASEFLGIGEARDRRQGCGTEACRRMCDHGFVFRSLHAIQVEVRG